MERCRVQKKKKKKKKRGGASGSFGLALRNGWVSLSLSGTRKRTLSLGVMYTYNELF